MKHETTGLGFTRRVGALTCAAAICLLLALPALAGTTDGTGQEESIPTAAEILDRYVEATGGREAYDKIRNRVTRATLEFVGQGLSLDMTIHLARPNLNYTTIESELYGTIRKGTDGETAWEMSMMTGPQIMKGQQKADFLRESALDRLARWRETYLAAESAGVETVGETDCYKVILTQQDGPPMTLFVDRESYLTTKIQIDLETPMGIVPMETFPGDFREVDGLLLAHSGRVNLVGQERLMTVHSIEHNVDLAADLFDLPEEIRGLVNKQASEE